MRSTDRRVVLITGCSSGFGRGMVSQFLKQGWIAIATLRKASERRSIFSDEMRAYPDRLFVTPLDLTDADERRNIVEFVQNRFNRLDCLVNNAGYGLFGALEDLTEQQIRRQMEVNFFGAAFLTRDLLPLLRKSRGRVIMMSTLFGFSSFPLSSVYCASKFAIEGLAESLYHELKPHGVQVTLVEPAGYRTSFGDNVVWGETSFEPTSAFVQQSENYRRFKQTLTSGKGHASAPVVQAVVRLASAKQMPLRCRIGAGSHMLYLLRKFFPQRLSTALLSAHYDKIFLKPVPETWRDDGLSAQLPTAQD